MKIEIFERSENMSINLKINKARLTLLVEGFSSTTAIDSGIGDIDTPEPTPTPTVLLPDLVDAIGLPDVSLPEGTTPTDIGIDETGIIIDDNGDGWISQTVLYNFIAMLENESDTNSSYLRYNVSNIAGVQSALNAHYASIPDMQSNRVLVLNPYADFFMTTFGDAEPIAIYPVSQVPFTAQYNNNEYSSVEFKLRCGDLAYRKSFMCGGQTSFTPDYTKPSWANMNEYDITSLPNINDHTVWQMYNGQYNTALFIKPETMITSLSVQYATCGLPYREISGELYFQFSGIV